jgi:hypothetical protein
MRFHVVRNMGLTRRDDRWPVRLMATRKLALAAEEIAAATGGLYTAEELAEADRLLAGWQPPLADAA